MSKNTRLQRFIFDIVTLGVGGARPAVRLCAAAPPVECLQSAGTEHISKRT